MKDPEMRQEAGFASRQEARKMVARFESLRNSLSYAQDIVLHDWDMIVELSRILDKIVARV
jgi:hypothetical protein